MVEVGAGRSGKIGEVVVVLVVVVVVSGSGFRSAAVVG